VGGASARLVAIVTMADAEQATALLPAPRIDVDALPYIDSQYNNPRMKAHVDALIEAELKTFRPSGDHLERWPMYEPNFEDHPLLEVEWMRVCDGQSMPKIDTSRYALDPPPPGQQTDPDAWRLAVQNAQSQLEHQGTRLGNLELLQQHGAQLWRAHLDVLDKASASFARASEDLNGRVETLNRKRKAEQLAAGPRLAELEAEWVGGVKKNLEIESQCLKLEAECAALRQAVEAKRQAR